MVKPKAQHTKDFGNTKVQPTKDFGCTKVQHTIDFGKTKVQQTINFDEIEVHHIVFTVSRYSIYNVLYRSRKYKILQFSQAQIIKVCFEHATDLKIRFE